MPVNSQYSALPRFHGHQTVANFWVDDVFYMWYVSLYKLHL